MVDSLTWLSTTLILIAALNLLAVLICLGLLALGRVRTRRLVEVGLEELDEWPSVSLIVPARNEELYIEKAVRSLTRLDYPRLQITIIDDRSTDRTGAMLDLRREQLDNLSAWPVIHAPSWILSVFMTTFAIYLFLFVRVWSIRNP